MDANLSSSRKENEERPHGVNAERPPTLPLEK